MELRPLRSDDTTVAVGWSKDVNFCLANGWRLGLTSAEMGEWLSTSVDGGQATLLRLGIEADRQLVGYVDLADMTDTSAEFGIAIGHSNQWGRGIGAAAGELLLRHAFDDLRLQRVDAEVPETNERSLRLMTRLGFRQVPTLAAYTLHREALVPALAFEAHRHQWEQGSG